MFPNNLGLGLQYSDKKYEQSQCYRVNMIDKQHKKRVSEETLLLLFTDGIYFLSFPSLSSFSPSFDGFTSTISGTA
jgi:hypothetical protein